VQVAGEAEERWLREALQSALPGLRAVAVGGCGAHGQPAAAPRGHGNWRRSSSGFGLNRTGEDAAVPDFLFTAPLPVGRRLPPEPVPGRGLALVHGGRSWAWPWPPSESCGACSRCCCGSACSPRSAGSSSAGRGGNDFWGAQRERRHRRPPLRRRDRLHRPEAHRRARCGAGEGSQWHQPPRTPPPGSSRVESVDVLGEMPVVRHPDRERRVPERQRPGAQLLHPRRRRHHAVDPQLVRRGGHHLQGRGRARGSTCQPSAPRTSPSRAAAAPRAR